MYGPKWPFLLMYGSHAMRQTGFPQVDGLSTDPRDLWRHSRGKAEVPKRARRSVATVHKGKIFGFLFRKSSFCTPIV